MSLEAATLRDFYTQPLGMIVRRLLNHRIRARWRSARGLTVVGLGYCAPYLGSYRGEARHLGALSPASQGALVWPRTGPKLAALVEERQLPLADNSVDRLLAVHCLEVAEREQALLREIWRVLAPEGRLLLVVPNRRGLWARLDTTPFGQGKPYSRAQLSQLLGDALLTPLEWSFALHVPPLERNVVLRSAVAFERMGARLMPGVGGVILVEARKEVMAPGGGLKVARALGGLVTIGANGQIR